MATQQTRRKRQTYGKSKRQLLFNLFDDGPADSASSFANQRPGRSERSPTPSSILQQSLAESLQDTALTRNVISTHTQPAPSPTVSDNDSTSDARPEPSTTRNVFDLASSDEEQKNAHLPTRQLKRRKVSSPDPKTSASENLSSKRAPKQSTVHEKTLPPTISATKVPPGIEVDDHPKVIPTRRGQKPLKPSEPPVLVTLQRGKLQPGGGKAIRLRKDHKPMVETPEENNDGPSLISSEQSLPSAESPDRTPRARKYIATTRVGLTTSPSDLALRSLSLESGDRLGFRRRHEATEDIEMSDTQSTTVRKRLVDRLDAPPPVAESETATRRQTKSPRERSGPNSTTPRRSSPINSQENRENSISRLSDSRNTSASDLPSVPGRARVTYAKQRSYLSESIAAAGIDLESSQGSNKDILSYPSYSSQLDLPPEDSDAEGSGIGGLKSIHELRKAGTDNRMDRDFELLFEDVNGCDPTKRVRALLRMGENIQNGDLGQHIIDNNKVSRLTGTIGESTDQLTGLLLAMILSTLESKRHRLSKCLDQICEGLVEIAPILLGEYRSLHEIAANYRPAIAKTVMADLTTFERRFGLSKDSRNFPIGTSASDLTVHSLDNTIKQLLERNETLPSFSKTIFNLILASIEKKQTAISGQDPQDSIAQLLAQSLSLLEVISAQFRKSNTKVTKEDYTRLGKSLAALLSLRSATWANVQQAALRVIVSLSNDNEDACQWLSATPILDEALKIIDERFLTLAGDAEQEQVLDKSTLDSVILSLGCLLNFADCDAVSRRRLYRTAKSGKPRIEPLISVFNQKIDLTAEAVTLDQSQILVAFGYLSMLLCTLCLDATIRKYIVDSTKGSKLENLLAATETFLKHVKTIESDPEMDSRATTFTERFAAILEEVKQTI